MLSGKWVSTIRFYIAVQVTTFLRNDRLHVAIVKKIEAVCLSEIFVSDCTMS